MSDARLKILEKISEAALNDALWSEVMEEIRVLLGGSRSLIFTSDIDPASPEGLWESRTVSPDDVAQYIDYYQSRDLWTINGLKTGLISSGRTFTGQEAVNDDVFLESEFYRDFVRHLDMKNLVTTAVSDGRGEVPRIMMSTFGGNASEPFSADAVAWYRSISGHVQNAITLRQRFRFAGLAAGTFEAVFDALTQPAVLADRDGRVITLNSAADELFRTTNDFGVTGRLTCRFPEDQRRLDAALAAVAGGVGNGLTEAVRGADRETPYLVEIRSVSRNHLVHSRVPSVMVLITAHRGPGEASVAAICGFYNLTPAETALCRHLLQGHTLIASAEILGVTEGTARQRLKDIFSKTGVSGQSGLVRLFGAY